MEAQLGIPWALTVKRSQEVFEEAGIDEADDCIREEIPVQGQRCIPSGKRRAWIDSTGAPQKQVASVGLDAPCLKCEMNGATFACRESRGIARQALRDLGNKGITTAIMGEIRAKDYWKAGFVRVCTTYHIGISMSVYTDRLSRRY